MNLSKKTVLLLLLVIGFAGMAGAQSLLSPLPHPTAIAKPAQGFNKNAKVIVIGDSTLPAVTGDTTISGLRLTGLSVLYGLTNGYTASNIYAGTGIGWEKDTYSSATGRWSTPIAVGLGVYEGGHIAPSNLQAVTAVGLTVALFNKFVILGVLYNINSPAGVGHFAGAVGGNAALVPTN